MLFFRFEFCVIECFYSMSNNNVKGRRRPKKQVLKCNRKCFLPIAQKKKNCNCILEECVCAKLSYVSVLLNEYGSKYHVLPSREMSHHWNWTGFLYIWHRCSTHDTRRKVIIGSLNGLERPDIFAFDAVMIELSYTIVNNL